MNEKTTQNKQASFLVTSTLMREKKKTNSKTKTKAARASARGKARAAKLRAKAAKKLSKQPTGAGPGVTFPNTLSKTKKPGTGGEEDVSSLTFSLI
jgi:hypothetical protein